MLLGSRLYERKQPTRDARLIIIYCEGKVRENDYFKYFLNISSQIKLEIEEPSQHDDNSPTGLYSKAKSQILGGDNKKIKYELSGDDEVWFVIDTDKWGSKIDELNTNCSMKENWFVAQSNPCFEVWLAYHFSESLAFDEMSIPKRWKQFLNNGIDGIKGGFDSRKHPILIGTAIKNAKNKYESDNRELKPGNTRVFKLAESFYPLIQVHIENALSKIKAEMDSSK